MKYEVKEMFDSTIGLDSFRRIDNTHPLNLYLGKDSMARKTLLLVSQAEPPEVLSSKLIFVHVLLRSDGMWALSFSLCDERYEDLFSNFCDDIITSSEDIKNPANGMAFVCDRYEKWKDLLRKNSSGLLTFAQIKGLLGELCFLKKYLFKKYGYAEAINSWIGPDKADQDFVVTNSWYEVKSTTSGTGTIQISSIEQLDTQTKGQLVIVYLDKTSRSDLEKITLNGMVESIGDMLCSGAEKRAFTDALIRQGYYHREEYDEYTFRFGGIARYCVGDDFPVLRRENVPSALVNAKYELSIAAIANYLVED